MSRVFPGAGRVQGQRPCRTPKKRKLFNPAIKTEQMKLKPFRNESRIRINCFLSTSDTPRLDTTSRQLELKTKDGVPVYVLGVDHFARQSDMGDFILDVKPSSVVLESAMSPEFGSSTGNTLTLKDADAGRSDATALRMLFAISNYLQSVPGACESKEWGEVKGRMYGEQLAAVAALTVGAELVYGDLPKALTYRRLLHSCSAEELDRSFGIRSAQNFSIMLGEKVEDQPADSIEKVLMTDRECALCYSIDAAANRSCQSGDSIVAVVGEAHLPGIKHLWEKNLWQDRVHKEQDKSQWRNYVFIEPESSDLGQHDLGVRRALAESVIHLRASGAVVQDMAASLGPIPHAQIEQYQMTAETYGCCRMLLAPLDHELFQKVVCSRGCNFWDELQPLRDIRPVNGGKGYDPLILQQLRELNFDLT